MLFRKGMSEAASTAGVNTQLPRQGSMFTIFFAKDVVMDYETATKADTKLYAKFFHHLLSEGVYLPPSQFETAFVSAAHTDGDIQVTIDAASEAFRSLV